MKTTRPDIATLALVALCVVAIAVLAALKVDVPAVLNTIALVGAGGAVGIALPQAAAASASEATPAQVVYLPTGAVVSTSPAPATVTAPVPAASSEAPADPAPAPAPASVTSAGGVTSTYNFPAAQ